MEKAQNTCLQPTQAISTPNQKPMELGNFNASNFAEILVEMGKQNYLLRSEVEMAQYKTERERANRESINQELTQTRELVRKQDSFIKSNAEKSDQENQRASDHMADLNRAIDSLRRQNDMHVKKIKQLTASLNQMRDEYKALKKLHHEKERQKT